MPAVSSLIAGGAAIAGAGSSIISGNKAAKAQKNAAKQAADVERYMYDTTRADFAPARQVGQGALYKLADMYGVPRAIDAPANDTAMPRAPAGGGFGGLAGMFGGNFGTQAQPTVQRQMTPGYSGFEASPGYQFRLSEGVKAAERSAAARGLLGSGGTLKAIQRYGEGLASSEYENYANALRSMAGLGQTATGATSAGGASAANGIARAFTNAGDARASSYANTGASINNGISNIMSSYLQGGFGGGGGLPAGMPGYGLPGGAPLPMPGNPMPSWYGG